MKELEGVDRKLSLAQGALNVSRGGLAILLRLVKVCNVLGDGRSSGRFPLLRRRLMAGAEVAGVLVPRALVAMGAHLHIKMNLEILFASALYWVSDISCWTADLR